jgi:hypothetical protein
MCGDDDEHDHDHMDEELVNRFLELAGRYNITPDPAGAGPPGQLTDENLRGIYMEGLLKAGLTRAINDAINLPEGERMDIIAGQSIVFARLAGLLAGLFPPGTDIFHTVISALMEGHGEATRIG